MRGALLLVCGRLAWMGLILLALSFALFFVLSALPGDPVDLLVTSNPHVRPDDVDRLKRLRGLDRPWSVRWARWLVGHPMALVPPPLSREPPIIVDMPVTGPARAAVAGVELEFARPGVHEVPRIVRNGHGMQGVVVAEVLVSPHEDGGRDRAVAARTWGRAVSLAAPRVYAAANDGSAHIAATELVTAGFDRSVPLDTWSFAVVTGPGAFVDGVWTNRFDRPGQTAIIYRATAPDGASTLGAFAVDHGLLEDPERFSRGALFVLLGDTAALGYSSTYKRPVWELLFGAHPPLTLEERSVGQRMAAAIQRFGRVQNTVCLMLPALLLSLLLAVPLGTLAAARRGGLLDVAVQAASVVGVAMPAFWLGIMSMQLFAVALPWLPAGGIQTPGLTELSDVLIDRLHHAVLPVCVLAFAWAGQWLFWVRSGLLEILPTDFVRTARAKGLAPRVVLVEHALTNAVIPLVTVVALAAPQMFAGALLTETVFAWPGVGRLQYEAIMQNDSYVAIVVFLVSAALVMLANLAADLAYLVLDPRLRRGSV